MTKLAILVAVGLLFTGPAFAQTTQGTNKSNSTMQSGQTGKADVNEKAKPGMGTTGSGTNSTTPAKESMQKDKSPASQGSGIKQEK